MTLWRRPAVTTKSKNYLHNVASDIDRRQWYRRPADLLVRAAYLTRGLRQVATRTCHIVDISEGGAAVEVASEPALPTHFYIVFGDWEYLVGSVVVQRRPGVLHVQFPRGMPTKLVNRLARISDPMRTLTAMPEILDEFRLTE